jgi:diguanylate cyclase (GGDEF)-like protein/PAS domain S-box-containing protein
MKNKTPNLSNPITLKGLNAETILRIVLDTIPIRVFWKDRDSTFIGGNKAFISDLGLTSVEQLNGKDDTDFSDDIVAIDNFRKDDLEVMASAQSKIGIEEPLKVPGQSNKWLQTNKVPMTDDSGDVIGILATYEDITQKVEYRQLIEQQALRDSLTGIANRRMLLRAIDNYQDHYAGLLFIDLDYFKAVNDSLGHRVGDALLQEVAKRLQSFAPSPDSLVARLGGDEFSLFVPLQTIEKAQESLELLASNIVDSFASPFKIDHHIISVGSSIGITFIDQTIEGPNVGFREADMAMYAAKQTGRNTYKFYDLSMREEAQRKHKLGFHLRSAIENKELFLLYQPQVDDNNNIIGAEALLRWNSAELGCVSPDEFIPLAEEIGLIHVIGDWVLNAALDDLVTLQPIVSRNPKFKMAVNFSSKQFQNKYLADDIEVALNNRHLNPRNLQVEITESVLIDFKDTVMRSMLKMQAIGISIAIDDFGTGYSSLSYLAMLPIDKLKIDRAFVTDLHNKNTNRKLVETLINMSHNLEMQVIAEGVETVEEYAALIALDCHQFQGFLFSRPISCEQIQHQYQPTVSLS